MFKSHINNMDILISRLHFIFFSLCLLIHTGYEYVLLSKDRPAFLSSQLDANTSAGKAVDGDISQKFPNMAVTQLSTVVYWYVDLQATRSIYNVIIYYRDEHKNKVDFFRRRFDGFSLYISDDTNIWSGSYCDVDYRYPPLICSINCPYAGRYVRLYNSRGNHSAILELAEVQVFGCWDPTKYGSNCAKSCQSTCKNNRCHAVTGHCYGCPFGYEGTMCDIISLLLSKDRPAYLSSQIADYTPARKAVDGDLRQTWPTMAVTNFGNTVDWYVDLEASRNIYGVKIYYRNENSEQVNAYRKRFAGFSLYISDDTNFKSGHKCEVNSTYPPLIYNIYCPYTGRYVRLYNSRSDGKAILELAEVQVFGCLSPTQYGQTCNNRCPSTCENNRCHAVSGDCLSCPAGFTGKSCVIVCENGTYGFKCNSTCSGNCKYNDHCNTVTGKCDHGCADGWTGSACDRECSPGRYGGGCSMYCNQNCKNGAPCHHVTGTCKDGCKDGFYSDKCSRSCSGNCHGNAVCNSSSGACEEGCAGGWKAERCDVECDENEYGPNCLYTCGKCKNEVMCDTVIGRCPSGCSPGYLTHICNESCAAGHYGEDCLQICSGHCINKMACNVGNGYCDTGCEDGWGGAKCEDVENSSQLVIGIAVGAGVVLIGVVVCLLVFILMRRSRNNNKSENNEDNTPAGSSMETFSAGNDNADSAGAYINLNINADVTSQRIHSSDNTKYQELSDISRDTNNYDVIPM